MTAKRVAWQHIPPVQRFWRFVDRTPACWVWIGRLNRGYGQFMVNRRNVYAHRFAYELLVGPIPEGMQLDHLCRNRACVNPAHVEPVTPRENTLRGESFAAVNATKQTCPQGHEYRVYTDQRVCRDCRNERARRETAERNGPLSPCCGRTFKSWQGYSAHRRGTRHKGEAA